VQQLIYANENLLIIKHLKASVNIFRQQCRKNGSFLLQYDRVIFGLANEIFEQTCKNSNLTDKTLTKTT